MKIMSIKKLVLALVLVILISSLNWAPISNMKAYAFAATLNSSSPIIKISPEVPTDIPVSGGTQSATLTDAAAFAWQEFIALNWPAVPQTGKPNTRDVPDRKKLFGQTGANPLVWQTYRGKVEIYPGKGDPHGYVNNKNVSYGYDDLPQYIYEDGKVPSCDGKPYPAAPWINLDEKNEIGLATMFAGVAPTEFPGQQFLYLAKANRKEYTYVAPKAWYNKGKAPFQKTVEYITKYLKTPQPNSVDYVSFPNGTIEIKSAWRKLTDDEFNSGRFHVAPVRYYKSQGTGQAHCYLQDKWGLAALHIIQKTPSAPYFIYATFEQADNILDKSGNPVEDVDGKLIAQISEPFDPNITSKDATANSQQVLSPSIAHSTPIPDQKQLYYQNTSGDSAPQGIVYVNKRKHDIPQEIIDVNKSAHAAITRYNQNNKIAKSPWNSYKLINVQFRPIDKEAGIPYTGDDAATYYQANSVVETDYNLQVFSGKLVIKSDPFTLTGLITDFNDDGTPFKNLYYAKPGVGTSDQGKGFNAGGCIGCHANASLVGSDFSFILGGGRVNAPEAANDSITQNSRLKRLSEFLSK